MMASDDKKTKANPVPKNEASPEIKSGSGADPKAQGGKAQGGKAEGRQAAAASPSGYHRGEGQKPVSQAYRDNWNVIFAKKKKR
jgi:hypothetical protein